jgi:antitoxin HigA-1
MAYTRDDIDRLDFSDIADLSDGTRIPPVHPGQILRSEFLEPLGMTQYRLAKALGVGARRIGEIIAGQRGMTADTALRLQKLFGLRADVWLTLQIRYDLACAEPDMSETLAGIAPWPLPSAAE